MLPPLPGGLVLPPLPQYAVFLHERLEIVHDPPKVGSRHDLDPLLASHWRDLARPGGPGRRRPGRAYTTPNLFRLRVASLHGSHDECASIKRPPSKLRDILVRICSDLSRKVLFGDCFCKEILKKQAACIVLYDLSFSENQ